MSDLRTDLAFLITRAGGNEDWEPFAEDYLLADFILREYYVISRKPLPRSERPVCPTCGTWVCSKCGYRRPKANRFVEQECKLPCQSKEGMFLDTRHGYYTYLDHLDALESFSTNKELLGP